MSETIKLATPPQVRAWAQRRGLPVGQRGPIGTEVIEAFNKAHRAQQFRPAALAS